MNREFDPLPDSNPDLVVLRQQLRRWESTAVTSRRSFSSGCAELDDILPDQGFRQGTLVEWFVSQAGTSVGSLALLAARSAMQWGGALAVLDRLRRFYPPSAASWDIDLEKLLWIQAANEKEEMWALDQALRSPAIAAVWICLPQVDAIAFRRMQLAVEASGCVGMLIRPGSTKGQPSWSDVQLSVKPLVRPVQPHSPWIDIRQPANENRLFQVSVVRGRGKEGAVVELELDQATGTLRKAAHASGESHPLHLASELAYSAHGRRASGA